MKASRADPHHNGSNATTFIDSTAITALTTSRAAAHDNGIRFQVTNPHGDPSAMGEPASPRWSESG